MIGAAFLQYFIRFILFSAVVLAGIFVGKKIRIAKDKKNIENVNQVKGNEYTNE